MGLGRPQKEGAQNYSYINARSHPNAFELLDQEWRNLVNGDDYNKIDLVWRQIIGFEMRRLPGIDRCVMAQGLYYVIEQHVDCARSYKFQNSDEHFPIMAGDDSLGGLGGDFSVDMFGFYSEDLVVRSVGGKGIAFYWKTYVEQKLQTCRTMQSQPEYQPTGCLIL